MLHRYDSSLKRVLRHPRFVMGILALTLVLTGYFVVNIPKGFLPDEDTGQIFAFTEGAQGISFDAMMKNQLAAAKIVGQNRSVDNFMSSIGASGISVSPNTGRMFIRLKPRSERPGVAEIIQDLRRKFATLPDIKVYPQILPTIRIGGQLTKALYQFTLEDADLLSMLDTPGEQRPILMPIGRFEAFRAAYDGAGSSLSLIQLDNVVLLLPGPYARCGR